MTSYGDRMIAKANGIITSYINITNGTTVPDVKDISLEKNQGIVIDAVYLYADMVDSSTLAQTVKKPVVAKILRSYLNPASSILGHYGGEIRSFDGDRVMAIFMGPNKETKAVRAALAVNWLVSAHLRDYIKASWTDVAKWWTLNHSIGIDVGEALLTRTGVRGDNDIVSIGGALNIAAKLSDVRNGNGIHISKAVYEPMDNEVAFVDGRNFWTRLLPIKVGGTRVEYFSTDAYWEPV